MMSQVASTPKPEGLHSILCGRPELRRTTADRYPQATNFMTCETFIQCFTDRLHYWHAVSTPTTGTKCAGFELAADQRVERLDHCGYN